MRRAAKVMSIVRIVDEIVVVRENMVIEGEPDRCQCSWNTIVLIFLRLLCPFPGKGSSFRDFFFDSV